MKTVKVRKFKKKITESFRPNKNKNKNKDLHRSNDFEEDIA